MQPRSKLLNHSARTLFGTLLTLILVSCGNKDKDDKDKEPVSQPVAQNRPAPAPAADPTAMFRTPNDERLPTQDQLDQGKHSSIGTGVEPVNNPDGQPSVSVKPPKPPAPTPPAKPDDQLDPEE